MKDLIAEAKATKVDCAEVKGLVEAVEGAPGAASFDALIAGLEQKKEKKQKAQSFASSMKDCVGMFKDHQARDHTCPLCDRTISPGSDVLKTFQEKLSEFLTDFDLSDSKQKIAAFEKQVVALQQARDKKAQAGTVQAQAQELAGQEDDLKQERERAERQLEDADEKQRRAQERYDKTENVSDFLRQLDLATLDRLKQKIAQAEAELSSRDLNQVGNSAVSRLLTPRARRECAASCGIGTKRASPWQTSACATDLTVLAERYFRP
jgi:DNA repair exonuclease SbcCD ATPase subunit